MFKLEQAISEWRQQMAAGGIKTPDVLDELESHLRDDVESQAQAGRSGQEAFDAAIQRLGQIRVLRKEFKNGRGMGIGRFFRPELIMMGVGLLCMAFGGFWYWIALKVALAIASALGGAGLEPVGLTWSALIFCSGAGLVFASVVWVIRRRRRTQAKYL